MKRGTEDLSDDQRDEYKIEPVFDKKGNRKNITKKYAEKFIEIIVNEWHYTAKGILPSETNPRTRKKMKPKEENVFSFLTKRCCTARRSGGKVIAELKWLCVFGRDFTGRIKNR